MSDEVVKKDMCDLTHGNLDKEIVEMKGQLKEHSADIIDLKLNHATLTAILKELTAKKPFWESDTGRKLLMWGFWLMALIVLTALGRDYLVDKIPK